MTTERPHFPRHTLEGRQRQSLEHVWIAAKMITDGKEAPTVERLEWIRELVDNSIELQRKVEKRNARAARQGAAA